MGKLKFFEILPYVEHLLSKLKQQAQNILIFVLFVHIKQFSGFSWLADNNWVTLHNWVVPTIKHMLEQKPKNMVIYTYQRSEERRLFGLLGIAFILIQIVLDLERQRVIVTAHHVQHLKKRK